MHVCVYDLVYTRKIIQYTLKKKGSFPNPRKRFRRFEKACKCVESSKKRIKKSTKPLKVLPLDTREEPFSCETFFKFGTAKKGFVKKIRNL